MILVENLSKFCGMLSCTINISTKNKPYVIGESLKKNSEYDTKRQAELAKHGCPTLLVGCRRRPYF